MDYQELGRPRTTCELNGQVWRYDEWDGEGYAQITRRESEFDFPNNLFLKVWNPEDANDYRLVFAYKGGETVLFRFDMVNRTVLKIPLDEEYYSLGYEAKEKIEDFERIIENRGYQTFGELPPK